MKARQILFEGNTLPLRTEAARTRAAFFSFLVTVRLARFTLAARSRAPTAPVNPEVTAVSPSPSTTSSMSSMRAPRVKLTISATHRDRVIT